MKGVICNQPSKNGVCAKHRLEKDTQAEKFLSIAKRNLGRVFEQIADCIDAERIYGADVYYHNLCMRNYFRNSQNCEERTSSQPDNASDEKNYNIVLEEVLNSLKPSLVSGIGFTPTEVCDAVND